MYWHIGSTSTLIAKLPTTTRPMENSFQRRVIVWKFEQKNFAKPKFEETDLYKKVFRKSFKRWIRRRRRRGQSLSCLTWPVRFRPVHFLCVAFDPFFFSFDLKNNVIQISTEPTYGTVLVAELAERWPLTLEVHSSNPIFVWHVWWEKLVRNGLFFIYFRSF